MSREVACADDIVGRLFGLLDDDGECIEMRYGQVTQDGVQWHQRSHARYDGIGGLLHVVRSAGGYVINDVPRMSASARPLGPEAVRTMARLWSDPTASWRRLPRGRAPQLVIHGRVPAGAWTVLDRERTAALLAASTAAGASVGGYMLSCLNSALAPHLSHEDGPALWAVPVNLRGGIRLRSRLSNHLSLVPVHLRANDDPRTTTRRMLARLEEGSHWAFHLAAVAVAGTGWPIASLVDALRGRSVGIFSNVGAWRFGGLGTQTSWVCCPPVTRFAPLGAGVMTVAGTLGLMLQAYPSLTMKEAEVRGWLDAWLELMTRDRGSGEPQAGLPKLSLRVNEPRGDQ